jgi:hypothetical protein
MNCNAVHSRLLGSEKPDRVPADVATHLKGCTACRKWQRRLVHLERNIALLPVAPAPRGKAAFVGEFLATELEPLASASVMPPESTSGTTSVQPRKFEKLAAAFRSTLQAPRATLNSFPAPARRRIAFVLAASLLLLAFAFWATHGPHGPFVAKPQDPLLASMMERDLRLASAQTPGERVETLADLADDLQGSTRTLIGAGQPDDLRALAELYKKVVSEGIVVQAQKLLPEERVRLLEGIAKRLSDTADETDKLAKVLPDSSKTKLTIIVNAARDGDRNLRNLMREGRS